MRPAPKVAISCAGAHLRDAEEAFDVAAREELAVRAPSSCLVGSGMASSQRGLADHCPTPLSCWHVYGTRRDRALGNACGI